MRRRTDDRPSLRGPVVCCLLAVGALSLGPKGEAAVRAAVRDAARPGYLLAGRLSSFSRTLDPSRWPWTTGPSPSTPRQVAKPTEIDETTTRRLRAELAAARNALKLFEASLGPVAPTRTTSDVSSLVERIPARVLDKSDPSIRPGGIVVAAGAVVGVEAGQPAVTQITLAAGERDGVSSDAAVLAGAAVLGRTGEVGAWTSTVIPVTAPEFRAHVRLLREGADGPVFGEEGLLEGDGRGACLVKYVPSTAAVAVGDHVYSHDPSGQIPQPLYFGTVESADLRDGAPHWEIRVRPAIGFSQIAEVHVLRPRVRELVQAAAN